MSTYNAAEAITNATRINGIRLAHNDRKYTAYRYNAPTNAYDAYFLVSSTGEYVKLLPVCGKPGTYGALAQVKRTRGCFKGQYGWSELGYVTLDDGKIANPAPITFCA